MGSKYTLEIVNTVKNLDKKTWNSLKSPKSNFLMTWEYCNVVENSFRDFSFFYVLVKDKNKKIVGKTYFYTRNLDLTDFCNKFYSPFLKILFWVLNYNYKKALILGNPLPLPSPPYVVKNKKILKLILNKIQEIQKSDNIYFSLIYHLFEENKINDFEVIKKHYYIMKSLPNNLIPLKNENLDSYFKKLSKNGRRNLKKNIEKGRKLTIIKNKNYCQHFNKEYYGLYSSVFKKSKYSYGKVPLDFFLNFSKNFKKSYLIEQRIDNKLCSFTLTIEDENTIYSTLMGLNYKLNEEYAVLFNSYYAEIKNAIYRKAYFLSMDQSTEFIKKRMGCVQEDLFIGVNMLRANKTIIRILKKTFLIKKNNEKYSKCFFLSKE